MSSANVFEGVPRFVRLMTEGEALSLPDLARALDQLAALVHELPEAELPDEDVDPPSHEHSDYEALCASLRLRFPDLGYYAVADPLETMPAEVMFGGSVDDLADIILDLKKVIWLSENSSLDDALWHFHFDFQCHWGLHLRKLSLYLHAVIWGPENPVWEA